jgi:hypothetical protein
MARALKLAGSPLIRTSLFTARVLSRGEKTGFGSDPIANDGRTLLVVDKALFWDAIVLSLSRGADFFAD